MRNVRLPGLFDRNWSVDVNFSKGPLISSDLGANGASSVCFNNNSGWIMLDLPELFAPARIVSGAISIDCSLTIDL